MCSLRWKKGSRWTVAPYPWLGDTYTSDMIPDKAPKEDVFHCSDELKKEAHISSFEQYKEMYLRSIESPDGEDFSFLTLTQYKRMCKLAVVTTPVT